MRESLMLGELLSYFGFMGLLIMGIVSLIIYSGLNVCGYEGSQVCNINSPVVVIYNLLFCCFAIILSIGIILDKLGDADGK